MREEEAREGIRIQRQGGGRGGDDSERGAREPGGDDGAHLSHLFAPRPTLALTRPALPQHKE